MSFRDLISRIPNHSEAPKARKAVADAFDIVDRFAARKQENANSGSLTTQGVQEETRRHLPQAAREVATARKVIEKIAADAKSRRDALRSGAVDRSDVVGALERREYRDYLRSLNPTDRARVLMGTSSVDLLTAALSAAPELSGLDGNAEDLARQVEQRHLQMTAGDALEELEALDQVVAEATAALEVARGELRNASGMNQAEFDHAVESADKVQTPWLIKNATEVQVCEIDNDGRATYRKATPREIQVGSYFESAEAFRAANMDVAA